MVVTISICSQADLKRDKFCSIIDAALRNLKEQKENTRSNKSRNNYLYHVYSNEMFTYLIEKSSFLYFISLDKVDILVNTS